MDPIIAVPDDTLRRDARTPLDPRLGDRRIEHLLAPADQSPRRLADRRSYAWAAIGLDSPPFPMNCSSCSHDQRWGA